MSTTEYFQDKLYPTNEQNGRADKNKEATEMQLFLSNYFGDHQIYLKLISAEGKETIFHLTKAQALDLSNSLERAVSYISYDNT